MSWNLGSEDVSDQIQNGTATGYPIRIFLGLVIDTHRAHAMGFVHRDFKPANIMVKNGQAYVPDTDSMDKVGTFKGGSFGTPCYLPNSYWDDRLGWNKDILDNRGPNAAINPFKKDQIALLNSVIGFWAGGGSTNKTRGGAGRVESTSTTRVKIPTLWSG